MKIYHISRKDLGGYDTYDMAIVIANSKKEAREMHPDNEAGEYNSFNRDAWVSNFEDIEVKYIGEAGKRHITKKVICASFNAG